jgi:hypothetical protein
MQRAKKPTLVSTGLVRISASCFLVEMYFILISPDLLDEVWTLLQKMMVLDGYMIRLRCKF